MCNASGIGRPKACRGHAFNRASPLTSYPPSWPQQAKDGSGACPVRSLSGPGVLNPKRATTAAAGYGGLLTESELLAISLFRLRRAAPPSSLSACFKLMCRLGMGRPATRAASCSAADSGRTASASSGYIGSIMCPVVCERSPPEYASSGADPSSGHQARMHVRGSGGSDDVSAKRCSCSRALAGLAVSDPKARSALYV